MRKYYCLSICVLSALLLTTSAYSQTASNDSIPTMVKKKRPKPIKHELSGGIRLHTDGWSLFMDRGRIKTPDRGTDYNYSLSFWQLEFGEKKHPQEVKRTNTIGSSTESSKPFVYGKANNFYALKIGHGMRKLIAGKPELNEDVEPGHVSVHWVYLGGISIGLEKPYFIDAYVNKNGVLVQETINYTDTTREAFLTQQYIVGSSGFGKGIGQTKIVPGIHAKTGLHFDFATTKKSKLAVETGLAFEYYIRAIELMANNTSRPYFVNAYVSFQFGKRWPQKK